MDLVGDIVEKEVSGTPEMVVQAPPAQFKPPLWGRRMKKAAPGAGARSGARKVASRKSPVMEATSRKSPVMEAADAPPASEAQRIHQENLSTIASLLPEEIEAERAELLATISPDLLASLAKRAQGKDWKEKSLDDTTVRRALQRTTSSPLLKPALKLAPGTPLVAPSTPKSVRFEPTTLVNYPGEPLPDPEWEDVDYLDDVAPTAEEAEAVDAAAADLIAQLHFPKPPQPQLELDDPDFHRKLHEKYFPELPVEVEKLKWMAPAPAVASLLYDSLKLMRFDFHGDIVPPELAAEVPGHLGLHHHAEQPLMAGYTLEELAQLARSTVPSQRLVAIQTLGRVVYKLGKRAFKVEDTEGEGTYDTFMEGVLALLKEYRVRELLELAADEGKTRNMSVRAYAIDALWLWSQSGLDQSGSGQSGSGQNEAETKPKEGNGE